MKQALGKRVPLHLTDREIDFLTERKIVGTKSYWLKTRNPPLYAKLLAHRSTPKRGGT